MMEQAIRGELVAAGALLAGAFFAGPLVRLNVRTYQALRMSGLAAFWSRRLSWWIPVTRVVCLTAGAALLWRGLS